MTSMNGSMRTRMRAGRRLPASLPVLAAVLLLGACAGISLAVGARTVPLSDVLETLAGGRRGTLADAVVLGRIPRTIFGLLAGASLGTAGVLMQAVTRNPVADPGILGVNTGAALAVVCGIAFLGIGTPGAYLLLALAGAGLTAVLVYGVGSLGPGGATPIKLALAGAAASAALSSAVGAVMLPRTEVMNAYRFWQVGSLGGADWQGIAAILPLLAVGFLLGMLLGPSLDALAMGDDMARGLGVRVQCVRIAGAAAGVLLCGAVTAQAGPIGFVGLLVPHVARMLTGPDHRLLLPWAAAGGALLMLSADIAGRLLGSPGELEAGIVTAFLGAPALIVLARKTMVKA